MPSTYISFQNLLAKACEEGVDLDLFKDRLLQKLRTDAIRVNCGEYIKSNLVVCFDAENYSAIIDFLPMPDADRRNALSMLGSGSPDRPINIHIWAGLSYYTIAASDRLIEVYSDGDSKVRFPGEEANPSFFQYAWLDDDRYAILCDDLENRSRRVFEKVAFAKADVHDLLSLPISKAPAKRGPKTRFLDEEVKEKAQALLLRNPGITLKSFEEHVRGWLGHDRQPGDTQFRKLYGYLWTRHNEERRIRGI